MHSWDAATKTFDRLLAGGSRDSGDLYHSTVLLFRRGGLAEFGRHRRRMLDLFAQSNDLRVAAERIGKACLLAPLPGPDQDQGRRLALRSDPTRNAGRWALPWDLLTRSLAECPREPFCGGGRPRAQGHGNWVRSLGLQLL